MTNLPDPRPTILLTGFGPFPGVPKNISADLVRVLAKRARKTLAPYRVVSSVLPTEWDRAPRLLASLHARHTPVLALHFGVATGTRGFRLETEARNYRRAISDASGSLPASTSLAHEGATVYAVTIAAKSIAAGLESNGYTVSLSDDAGGYLCNAILYHSLALAEESGGTCRVGFVHIPADLSNPPLTLPEAVAGALEIVKFALELPAAPNSLTST
jgi:pyroglutamyl-peptidase